LSDLADTPSPLPPPLPAPGDWQPLPRRAATLAGIAGAITGAIVIGGVLGTLWVVLDMPMRWLGAVAMLLPGALVGAFFGYRRQRKCQCAKNQ